jgi:hypothetical protein
LPVPDRRSSVNTYNNYTLHPHPSFTQFPIYPSFRLWFEHFTMGFKAGPGFHWPLAKGSAHGPFPWFASSRSHRLCHQSHPKMFDFTIIHA